ncbi:MAG: CDP-alcohol phosphatidyltransferase family protein [Magnetococcus sp. WYHC-3]
MDYFNPLEQEYQNRFAHWRDERLRGVTGALRQRGISANHITALGLVHLLAACISGPWLHGLPAALFLLLYCVLDGMDGPLARASGQAHAGGAMVDMSADQMGVAAISAACVVHLDSSGLAAVLFSNFYLGFIVLVTYAKQARVPMGTPFIRVKYPFYMLYVAGLASEQDLVTGFMLFFAAYYSLMGTHRLVLISRYCRQSPPAPEQGGEGR